MGIDFDIQKIKKKAESFTPQKDRIASAVQLAVCIAGVAFVMLHEVNSFSKNKSRDKKK